MSEQRGITMKNQVVEGFASIPEEVAVSICSETRQLRVSTKIAQTGIAVSLLFSGLLFGALFAASTANAVTLEGAGSERVGVSVGDLVGTSYDGPDFDAFKPFQSASSSTLLSLGAFNGQAQGSLLEVTLLSEAAGFDGSTPGFANDFGVLNAAGDFISILDTANIDPGGSGTLFQGADDTFTFALLSPEALFSADDKENPDGAAHLVAFQADQDMTVTIDRPSLRSNTPLTFELLAGDIVIFIEDMLLSGNQTASIVPGLGDFDYNDMVVLVRQSEIPEPATLALLGTALLGLGCRRRKQ